MNVPAVPDPPIILQEHVPPQHRSFMAALNSSRCAPCTDVSSRDLRSAATKIRTRETSVRGVLHMCERDARKRCDRCARERCVSEMCKRGRVGGAGAVLLLQGVSPQHRVLITAALSYTEAGLPVQPICLLVRMFLPEIRGQLRPRGPHEVHIPFIRHVA